MSKNERPLCFVWIRSIERLFCGQMLGEWDALIIGIDDLSRIRQIQLPIGLLMSIDAAMFKDIEYR